LGRNVAVSLPVSIADELAESQLAQRVTITRGTGFGEIFLITVDCINTAGAVVSIAIAITNLRKLARALIKRRHASDPDIMTIEVQAGGHSKSITVNRTVSSAEDELLAFLIEMLAADRTNDG
jgi:hypothetical protein